MTTNSVRCTSKYRKTAVDLSQRKILCDQNMEFELSELMTATYTSTEWIQTRVQNTYGAFEPLRRLENQITANSRKACSKI